MTTETIDEQLTKYLTDAHSIERQALVQMKLAPKIAGEPALAAAFSAHLTETEEHERLVTEALERRDASRSIVKDAAGTLTGLGFGAFAAVQPDTPGKLLAHALSYEHMEEAAYQLLSLLALRAGDEDVARMARTIEEQERGMGERLEGLYDEAVAASLDAKDASDLGAELDKYLADAHAIEKQAAGLLEKGIELAGTEELAAAYKSHLTETLSHTRLIETRLDARDESPSALKDAALKTGALNWGAFFSAQPDTPAKLAAFSYAFEYLEIGAYELLRRVAHRAGDEQTAQIATRILTEERAAAAKINSLFAESLDASLRDQGLPVGAGVSR